ncbi:MAG TPA: hypothetical protein VLD40_08180 [Dissulfurispiraceae bacterium]|nr:hypothetical protein [Dissulfurispiraceae bacterium]
MNDLLISTISATLQDNPLCHQIMHFLIQNESAMDTVKGIAACWVDSDEVAVRSALDYLITCGAVSAYTLGSGTLYGLTRNPGVRAGLRSTFGINGKH